MDILQTCLAMIETDDLQRMFETIYYQYKNLMYQRAYEILKNSENAEDTVHEAFIKIAKNMHMVSQVLPERRKALIMRILENTAIDFYRKNQKEEEYLISLELDEFLELNAEAKEDETVLAYAILKMPLQYQQIFFLKYAHGYDNREIAQLLGITVSAIEKTLSRGKRKLKQYVQEVSML